MPESILDVAEGERACRGSHVDHQDQGDRILRREAERLFGVNRSQRDDRLDPRLIEDDAYQEPSEVSIARGLAQRLREARKSRPHQVFAGGDRRRTGALPEHPESRQARQSEDRGSDQHCDGHKLLRFLAVGLCPGDIAQAKTESQKPAQIAQTPAPTRYPSQRLALGEFGQERCDKVFPRAEAEVGKHEQHYRNGERSGPSEREQGGRNHATSRGENEQALFCGTQVGIAPRIGPVSRITAYEADNVAVHAKVAQGALPAITETKYALKTAVITTVV